MSGHLEDSFEYVRSHVPFVVRRTIRWGDCDPAGLAFTGRFPEYLLSATALFMRHLRSAFGSTLQTFGVDMPCKALSLVFHAPLHPDDVVDLRVTVGEMRDSSFDLLVHAMTTDGRLAFEGVVSPICIATEPRGRVAIPPLLRERLSQYQTPT